MSAASIITKAIKSGALIEGLIVIPSSGATELEITREEALLPRTMSEQHKDILRCWNGVNLDILRLYGCSDHEELRRLSETQGDLFSKIEGAIAFGDDPAGFIYAESADGSIYSSQVSTGEEKKLAENLNDFFERLVFGEDAKEFGGEDWEKELVDAGLIQ